VTPFVEWYDSQGNYITRVLARNPVPGTSSMPDSFAYDSFTAGSGTLISGRTTDDGNNTWVSSAGYLTLSPFAGGSVYPAVTGQRTEAYITMSAFDCQVGVTFLTAPEAGQSQALLLRQTDNTHYIRADWTQLKQNNGGLWT
jgi:hypothetical protein